MSTKKKRSSRVCKNRIDRISSLTDEVIHEIMSFMNTKYAVQTCVLSKRWKSLWKSLPFLDFNYSTFPFQGGLDRWENEPKINSLNNFMIQVLFRRHQTDLVKLCFQSLSDSKLYFSIIEGLIAYAVDHNLQQLILNVDYDYWDSLHLILPESFYTCKSLTVIQLNNSNYIRMKLSNLALPSLKSLHLDQVLLNEKDLNLSGCPNLETLKLDSILHMGENRTLFIDAPKLKRLGFRCEGYYRGKVVIDAPDLRTFHYCALITPSVCSFDVDLASIDDAYFNMCIYEDEEDPKCREYVVHWINTLEKFCNAKSLTLSWGTIKVLAMFPSLLDENRVSFANLKQLKIDLQYWLLNEVKVPGCVLNFFLNSSTRLEFVCEGK